MGGGNKTSATMLPIIGDDALFETKTDHSSGGRGGGGGGGESDKKEEVELKEFKKKEEVGVAAITNSKLLVAGSGGGGSGERENKELINPPEEYTDAEIIAWRQGVDCRARNLAGVAVIIATIQFIMLNTDDLPPRFGAALRVIVISLMLFVQVIIILLLKESNRILLLKASRPTDTPADSPANVRARKNRNLLFVGGDLEVPVWRSQIARYMNEYYCDEAPKVCFSNSRPLSVELRSAATAAGTSSVWCRQGLDTASCSCTAPGKFDISKKVTLFGTIWEPTLPPPATIGSTQVLQATTTNQDKLDAFARVYTNQNIHSLQIVLGDSRYDTQSLASRLNCQGVVADITRQHTLAFWTGENEALISILRKKFDLRHIIVKLSAYCSCDVVVMPASSVLPIIIVLPLGFNPSIDRVTAYLIAQGIIPPSPSPPVPA